MAIHFTNINNRAFFIWYVETQHGTMSISSVAVDREPIKVERYFTITRKNNKCTVYINGKNEMQIKLKDEHVDIIRNLKDDDIIEFYIHSFANQQCIISVTINNEHTFNFRGPATITLPKWIKCLFGKTMYVFCKL